VDLIRWRQGAEDVGAKRRLDATDVVPQSRITAGGWVVFGREVGGL